MMISLIINPNSVRVSKSKVSTQIFSEIHFQVDSMFFPEENWDDFTVVILDWWLQEACRISLDSKGFLDLWMGLIISRCF